MLTTKLLSEYLKKGNLKAAKALLQYENRTDTVDVKIYGLMLSECVRQRKYEQCFRIYEEMNDKQIKTNHIIYLILLKACRGWQNLDALKAIHFEIIKHEQIWSDIKIQNALIGGYSQCDAPTAWQLYQDLQGMGVVANIVTFLSAIQTVSAMKDHRLALHIHETINQMKLNHDIKIQNALISMYCKCHDFEAALAIFNELKNGQTAKCDEISYLSIIRGCAQHRRLDIATQIAQELDKQPFMQNNVKLQNAVIHMFTNCGDFESSIRVFHKMRRKDINTFALMLRVCAQSTDPETSNIIREQCKQFELEIYGSRRDH